MCAWHIKFKEWLKFEHCVVEKLLLSVKLVSPFRNHSSVLWSQLTFKLVAFFAWSHWCNGDNLKMWLNVTQVSFAVWRKGLALREVRFLVLFVPVDSETLCPLHSVNSLACLGKWPTSNTAIRHEWYREIWTICENRSYWKVPSHKTTRFGMPKTCHTSDSAGQEIKVCTFKCIHRYLILQGGKGVYIQVHTQIPTRGDKKTC